MLEDSWWALWGMKLEDDTTNRVNVESLRRLELVNLSFNQCTVSTSCRSILCTTDEVNVNTAVNGLIWRNYWLLQFAMYCWGSCGTRRQEFSAAWLTQVHVDLWGDPASESYVLCRNCLVATHKHLQSCTLGECGIKRLGGKLRVAQTTSCPGLTVGEAAPPTNLCLCPLNLCVSCSPTIVLLNNQPLTSNSL